MKRMKKRMEKRKPKFLRQGWRSMRQLRKVKWRKTKGVQSKMRRGERGKAAMPHVGYGSDRQLRDLHPSGFREVLVHSINELQSINAKNEAVKIAAAVGNKKRAAIMEKAKELKIKVLNPFKVVNM